MLGAVWTSFQCTSSRASSDKSLSLLRHSCPDSAPVGRSRRFCYHWFALAHVPSDSSRRGSVAPALSCSHLPRLIPLVASLASQSHIRIGSPLGFESVFFRQLKVTLVPQLASVPALRRVLQREGGNLAHASAN